MIHVDHESMSIKGNKPILFSEITGVVRDFYQKGIMNDKDLEDLIEMAKMSDEELEERAKAAKKDILRELDIFGDLLNEAIKMDKKEEENEN